VGSRDGARAQRSGHQRRHHVLHDDRAHDRRVVRRQQVLDAPRGGDAEPGHADPGPAWLQESVATEPSSEGIWQVTREPIRYKQPTRLIVVDTLAKAQSSGSTTTKALVTDDVPLYGVAGRWRRRGVCREPERRAAAADVHRGRHDQQAFRFPFRVKGRDKITGYMQFDFAADVAAFTAGNYGTVRLGHATDNHLVSDFFPMHSINPQDAVFVGTATSAIFSSIGASASASPRPAARRRSASRGSTRSPRAREGADHPHLR
jgi:hypothetical protein